MSMIPVGGKLRKCEVSIGAVDGRGDVIRTDPRVVGSVNISKAIKTLLSRPDVVAIHINKLF